MCPAGDVAADVVGVVVLKTMRGRDVAGEDNVTETRCEAFNLLLDQLGRVAVISVRHVGISP